MKIKLLPLVAALVLLAGCARRGGEYYTSQSHSEREPDELSFRADSDITGYYTLKSALLNMVSMGVQEDIFRIGGYGGDLEEDLNTVIQEITTQEPIGLYGVASINADRSRVLSYQEVAVRIQYKRSPADMQAVTHVSGSYDLANRLADMLRTHGGAEAYYITGGAVTAEELDRLVYAAWMRGGSNAPALTSVGTVYYPENSPSAIIEVMPIYPSDETYLISESDFIRASAESVCAGYTELEPLDKLSFINTYLYENILPDVSAQRVVNETGGKQPKTENYTAAGVFRNAIGAQSGFVLAASAMCDALGLEHTVQTGQINDDIYSWLEVNVRNESYIFDVTALQSGREVWLYAASDAGSIFTAW